MARGKSINLYLMDGEASGRIKCTLANWTGVAYKIPRTELDKCKEREDLKWSGVYFLFGTSDETEKNIAYIGQAGVRKNGEGILNRLYEHKRNPDKDYWTEAVVFTTSNNSFGPTEISYLENRFCNLAIEAGRYTVKNGNDPTPGHITEEKESELEEFVENAKLIMGTLGHKVFIPYDDPTGAAVGDEQTLYITRKKSGKFIVKASGRQTTDGFVVLKNSIISPNYSDKLAKSILDKRKKCKIDENNVLLEDVQFGSPSGASDFVTGQSTSGWREWKTADGITLRELEDSKQQATQDSANNDNSQ